jgi:ribosomal protein L28
MRNKNITTFTLVSKKSKQTKNVWTHALQKTTFTLVSKKSKQTTTTKMSGHMRNKNITYNIYAR